MAILALASDGPHPCSHMCPKLLQDTGCSQQLISFPHSTQDVPDTLQTYGPCSSLEGLGSHLQGARLCRVVSRQEEQWEQSVKQRAPAGQAEALQLLY